MSNINFQMKNIRLQLKNMDLLVDNIIQGNMNLNLSSSQIQNIGIQMLNMGIQVLNIGIQIPDINNNLNIHQEIQFVIEEIKYIDIKINNPMRMPLNMGMGINNIMMNNNVGMGMNNMMMNNFGIQMNGNIENDNKMMQNIESETRKKDFIFETSSGKILNICVDYDKTIEDLIRIFFENINKPELIKKTDKILFLYNEFQIDINNKKKVSDYFKYNKEPISFIIDGENLI